MYARVISHDAPVPELAALRREPGFSGALSLVRAATDGVLVLLFWETEQQAYACACDGEVWEVVARA